MENDFIQSGSIIVGLLAIITLIIRELFAYLKSRKNGGENGFGSAILEELKSMNNNHLHSLKDAIESGNKEIVRSINDTNRQTIELLGEIKGNLTARR